jgi:hypothetical protein
VSCSLRSHHKLRGCHLYRHCMLFQEGFLKLDH